MYLIYCKKGRVISKKILSDGEMIQYLLDDYSAGSFCVVANSRKTLLANALSPIILME